MRSFQSHIASQLAKQAVVCSTLTMLSVTNVCFLPIQDIIVEPVTAQTSKGPKGDL